MNICCQFDKIKEGIDIKMILNTNCVGSSFIFIAEMFPSLYKFNVNCRGLDFYFLFVG